MAVRDLRLSADSPALVRQLARDGRRRVLSGAIPSAPTYAPATAAPGEPRDAHHVDLGTANEPDWTRALLLEPATTNAFTAGTWITNNATVSGSDATAFDGSGTSKAATATAAGGHVFANVSSALTNGATYSFSVYLRSDVPGTVGINVYNGSAHKRVLVTVGPVWSRHDVSFVAGSTTYVYPLDTRLEGTLSAVEFSCVQIEPGNVPSSYVPTYGAPATRAAESLRLGPVVPVSLRTLYLRFTVRDAGEAGTYFLTLGDNAANAYVTLYQNANRGHRAMTRVPDGAGGMTSLYSAVHAGGAVALGDVVELRLVINDDGSTAEFGRSVNGGSEVVVGALNGATGVLPASWGDGRVRLGQSVTGSQYPLATHAVGAFGSPKTLAECRTGAGDLLTFRPSEGDTVAAKGGTYSGPSAKAYTAKNPAPLVAGPDAAGWLFADPGEAYVGGRVPLRDHTGAVVGSVVQGIDDAVGTSDPALTKAGWGILGAQQVRLLFTGDLDVPRSLSDLTSALTSSDADGGIYVAGVDSGYMQRMDTSTSTSAPGFGDPTYHVDGAQVSRANQDLFAAACDGATHYIEARAADLSARAGIRIGFVDGTLHALALHLGTVAPSAASRATAHAHVRALCARRGVALPALP